MTAAHPVTIDVDDFQESAAQARRSQRGDVKRASKELKFVQILSYPPNDANAVTLTLGDVERLKGGQFLNDSLIDFWCRHVTERLKKKPTAHNRMHIFSSFLYAKLVQQGLKAEDRFTDALKWSQTQGVDIFSKDYIFIPICEKLHWTLAVICFPGAAPTKLAVSDRQIPCILHLNSIRSPRRQLGTLLRKYLQKEWDARHNASKGKRDFLDMDRMPLYEPYCPQQSNEWDCGIFVLEFLERMCGPDHDGAYGRPEPTLEVLKAMPDASSFFDRLNWFSESAVQGHRNAFRGIVDRMQDDQVENQQIFTEASAEAATRRGGGRALAAAAAADERAAGGKRRRAAGRDDVDGEDGREQQHESEDRGVSSCWQQCIPEGDENVEMKDQSLGGAGARRLGGEVGKRTRGARDVSPGESRHESQGGVGRGGGSEQGLVLVDEDKVRNERSNSWSEKMAATVGQVAALAVASKKLVSGVINSIINIEGEESRDGLTGAERGGRHVGRELYPELGQNQEHDDNEDPELQKAIRLSQETHEEEIRRRQPERSRGQRQGVHGAEIDSDQIDCDALDSPVEVEEPPPPPRTEAPEGEDGSDRPRRRGTGGDAGVSHDSDDHSADHAKLEAKFFESSTSKSKRSGITEPNRIEPAPLTGVNDMTPNNGRKESKGGRGDSDDSILLLI